MNNILLTGSPGIGKTTAIMKSIELINAPVVGFFTEEIRDNDNKKRIGFRIVSSQNRESKILAHIEFNTRFNVGKYKVKPDNLLQFLKEIDEAVDNRDDVCIIIDEIGKMELFTAGFKETVNKALESKHPLIATIMKGSNKFCDQVKNRNDVSLIEVTEKNRDYLPNKISGNLLN